MKNLILSTLVIVILLSPGRLAAEEALPADIEDVSVPTEQPATDIDPTATSAQDIQEIPASIPISEPASTPLSAPSSADLGTIGRIADDLTDLLESQYMIFSGVLIGVFMIVALMQLNRRRRKKPRISIRGISDDPTDKS